MLLVFVSITAYSLNDESKTEITVDEGYDEMNIDYIKPESGITYQNENGFWYKNATVKTTINGENNYFKFEVAAKSATSYSNEYELDLKLNIKGNFEAKYTLDTLLLKMKESDGKNISYNHQDFNTAKLKEKGINIWSTGKRVDGSFGQDIAVLGFDINKNHFTAELEATMVIPKHNWNNSYTLKLKTIVNGMSKDVKATVDVNLEGDFRA